MADDREKTGEEPCWENPTRRASERAVCAQAFALLASFRPPPEMTPSPTALTGARASTSHRRP